MNKKINSLLFFTIIAVAAIVFTRGYLKEYPLITTEKNVDRITIFNYEDQTCSSINNPEKISEVLEKLKSTKVKK